METDIRQDIVTTLKTADSTSPSIGKIKGMGESAIPELISIIQDKKLLNEKLPENDSVPLMAIQALTRFENTKALEATLDTMLKLDPIEDDDIYENIEVAAGTMAREHLCFVLEKFQEVEDREHKIRLGDVLYQSKSKDTRIFDVYVDNLRSGHDLSAQYLVDFGDLRAIPIFSHELDKAVVSQQPFHNLQILELKYAIEELGGKLTPQQHFKCKQVIAIRDKAFAPARGKFGITIEKSKTGRNDPCPCCSGKKYKKCCGAN